MRLVFVTDSLVSGGAERVISILANYLSYKQKVVIICLKKEDVFYAINSNVTLIHLDDYCQSKFQKICFLRNYFMVDDIIIPFMEPVYCKVMLCLIGKTRIIIPSERNDPNYMKFRWTFLRRLFMYKISKFVVQTYKIKEYYPKFFQEKITVIPNPVEPKQYTTEPWNRNSKIVLAVARTDVQKNYPMMIKAFCALHKFHPDYHLEIYGCRDMKSEYVKSLYALIHNLSADSYIHIHGRVENVSELYHMAYMFVMSSDYEGLSNSLIEAMCSGLPVVSTKVSGATDLIVDRENGLLVDIGDENGFSKAMLSLIENQSLAQHLGNNATKCRNTLHKDKICEKWENMLIEYNNAIKK